MWAGAKIAVQLAVVGAAMVVVATRGAGTERVDGAVTAASYVPSTPVSALAPAAHPRIWSPRPQPRPATRAPARRHHAVTRHRAHGAATRHATPRHAVRHAHRPTSYRSALMAAVARIPTYRPGGARWVISRAYDYWGTADWYHDVLYVSPDVPRSKLYDVAVHEWSHELSVLDYSGDVDSATRAMNAWFGGTGLTGAERAADCMAILQGADWTHYTTCTDSHWREGARLLVSGRPL
jgi:plasmid stabilization system protein ParE